MITDVGGTLSTNALTIQTSGGDTVMGGTSTTITNNYRTITLIADYITANPSNPSMWYLM
jgi:hypothetical protein